MTCPDCERYKESAKNWRHKAYELSGHPLPWERGDTWVGLTDEEIYAVIRPLCNDDTAARMLVESSMDEYRAIEAKLKEKNNG